MLLLLCGQAYAQTKSIALKDALKKVTKTFGTQFVYDRQVIEGKSTTFDLDNLTGKSVEEVLKGVLYPNSLVFLYVKPNYYTIVTKEKVNESNDTQGGSSGPDPNPNPVASAQRFKVSGVVRDTAGMGVPRVSVTEKGTTNTTVTTTDGSFTINVSSGQSTLLFTSVGFAPLEMPVANQTALAVSLRQINTNLGEVVVVGYGSQRRSDVTGSVASVPKSRLSQLPVTNIMHAIEGAVAGVSVTQNSAVPGRTATVQVRGINSIAANNSPLIVVDGLPLSQDASTNDINPNDIASMEILKDASAVAIYGVRGSNGVILITTKRGTGGKPVVRLNTYAGPQRLSHILEPSDPKDYVQKWADYKQQTNRTDTTILGNVFERNNYYGGAAPVDWLDLVTQKGLIQDHNLSISGGTKDVKYFVSGDYMKEKGVVRGYQYQRASIRTNLDINVTDYLTIGTSLFYANNNSDGGRANFFFGAHASPYGSVYKADGTYEIYPMFAEQLYTNPLLGLTTTRIDRGQNFNGNGYAELKLGGVLKGLKFRVNGGYFFIPVRRGGYTGRSANDNSGTATSFTSESKNWIIENILSYSRDWNKHHFDFTGLYSAQKKDYYAAQENGVGFINDILGFYNISAATSVSAGEIFRDDRGPFSGSYRDVKTGLSQMGRINYSYNSKYLLTVTARRDGSSVFGSNVDKYGVFPSVAVGWNISNEEFLQGSGIINNLKLRASYGKTGNEAITINGTQTIASLLRYPFGGQSTVGVLANYLGNKDLHWETTKGLNVGADFAILNNRITGSIDAYRTKTEDLILKRKIPSISGYSQILDNLGRTQNKGIEISLNTVNIKSGDFRWESNLNFSAYRNKIISLYGNMDSLGNEVSDISNGWFIGQPVRSIYDYKMVGVWQVGENPAGWDAAAKPGYLKFADLSGPGGKPDGKIDDFDKVIQGSPLPKWMGGITNTFHYKDFHFSVFIQTVQGVLRNNVNLNYADEAWRVNMPKEIGYWTATNKSQTRPSLDENARAAARGYGYPSDGSYTRIKDATLSYTMPQEFLDKVKLGGLTLYVSGRNLHTFTKWIGWDPEFDYSFRGSGDWTNNYPLNRTIVFGANITLR
jgi:TonB-linked SusC/RagA family outer membrane protein